MGEYEVAFETLNWESMFNQSHSLPLATALYLIKRIETHQLDESSAEHQKLNSFLSMLTEERLQKTMYAVPHLMAFCDAAFTTTTLTLQQKSQLKDALMYLSENAPSDMHAKFKEWHRLATGICQAPDPNTYKLDDIRDACTMNDIMWPDWRNQPNAVLAFAAHYRQNICRLWDIDEAKKTAFVRHLDPENNSHLISRLKKWKHDHARLSRSLDVRKQAFEAAWNQKDERRSSSSCLHSTKHETARTYWFAKLTCAPQGVDYNHITSTLTPQGLFMLFEGLHDKCYYAESAQLAPYCRNIDITTLNAVQADQFRSILGHANAPNALHDVPKYAEGFIRTVFSRDDITPTMRDIVANTMAHYAQYHLAMTDGSDTPLKPIAAVAYGIQDGVPETCVSDKIAPTFIWAAELMESLQTIYAQHMETIKADEYTIPELDMIGAHYYAMAISAPLKDTGDIRKYRKIAKKLLNRANTTMDRTWQDWKTNTTMQDHYNYYTDTEKLLGITK